MTYVNARRKPAFVLISSYGDTVLKSSETSHTRTGIVEKLCVQRAERVDTLRTNIESKRCKQGTTGILNDS
jgi:hypothetical protein